MNKFAQDIQNKVTLKLAGLWEYLYGSPAEHEQWAKIRENGKFTSKLLNAHRDQDSMGLPGGPSLATGLGNAAQTAMGAAGGIPIPQLETSQDMGSVGGVVKHHLLNGLSTGAVGAGVSLERGSPILGDAISSLRSGTPKGIVDRITTERFNNTPGVRPVLKPSDRSIADMVFGNTEISDQSAKPMGSLGDIDLSIPNLGK